MSDKDIIEQVSITLAAIDLNQYPLFNATEAAQQIDQLYRKHYGERLVEAVGDNAVWIRGDIIKLIKQELSDE